MKINEIVILAGGLGTRLRDVLPDIPKPLAIVNGKPFLFHLLEFWLSEGLNKIILAVGYKHEIIIDEIKNSKFSPYVNFSIEKKLLGTGGAIIQSLNFIENEHFLVQNGDTYIPIKLDSLLKSFKKNWEKTLFIAVVAGSNKKRYKLLSINKDGMITHFQKRINYKGINSGLYILKKSMFLNSNYVKEKILSFEDTILNDLIIRNECAGDFFETPFIDIGVPVDYYKANDVLRGNKKETT